MIRILKGLIRPKMEKNLNSRSSWTIQCFTNICFTYYTLVYCSIVCYTLSLASEIMTVYRNNTYNKMMVKHKHK